MKTILAFGDSLTWGFKAAEWTRHAFEDRWPNVLAKGLGGKAHVIEEGHNGRTTIYDDGTCLDNRKGSDALPILLATHQPLDLVIIMLGTNDIKWSARCRAFDARLGMMRLIEITKSFGYLPDYKAPQILIMSPPALVPTADEFFNELWGHAVAESKRFAHHYRQLAEETGVRFFDAGSVAVADPRDGGHLDAENTRAIGTALVPVVKKILEI